MGSGVSYCYLPWVWFLFLGVGMLIVVSGRPVLRVLVLDQAARRGFGFGLKA